jgi:S-DNA-T family DNA segregation ATPase FtsK/SpoIIIE
LNLTAQLLKLLPGIQEIPSPQREQIVKLSMKMSSLGFYATFRKAEVGPVVRTYFFEPFPDVQLSKITSREEDIAMSLGVEAVLITRDLGLVSIAVPRIDRELIPFDQCLYDMFKEPSVKEMILPLLLGKNTKGEPVYLDLAKQPHLLIAGATGAGKSIFTSQLILSLSLLRSSEEMEFILADTKQLDLVLFKSLPHVSSVVTNVTDLRNTLDLLRLEYEERTKKMSGFCRNAAEWNKMALGERMKYKILIIDEFADVVGADRALLAQIEKKYRPYSIEDLVKRLAQVCRAVGIHIILATQRPSVKIIEGDLKANFPARIAFKLVSMQDSRVILDENGAEKLLGNGDFLYRTATSDQIKRAHSSYVSMTDISAMISQHEMLRMQFGVL